MFLEEIAHVGVGYLVLAVVGPHAGILPQRLHQRVKVLGIDAFSLRESGPEVRLIFERTVHTLYSGPM